MEIGAGSSRNSYQAEWLLREGGGTLVLVLEGFGIGCSEGGAGGANGSSWGILLPVARVLLEFLCLPPDVYLSLRMFCTPRMV